MCTAAPCYSSAGPLSSGEADPEIDAGLSPGHNTDRVAAARRNITPYAPRAVGLALDRAI